MPSLFKIPLTSLDGIGPKKAQLFSKLGAESVGELLMMYPRTYEDMSEPRRIREADSAGPCCVRAVVEHVYPPSRIRKNMTIFKLSVTDGESRMNINFFNQQYMYEKLQNGGEYLFYGYVKKNYSLYEMSAPVVVGVDEENKIRPVYSLTGSLTNNQIVKAVKQALAMLPEHINDPLPQYILDEYGLCTLDFAIRNIHFPKDSEALLKARKRLVFEELLVLQLGMLRIKTVGRKGRAHTMQKGYADEFFSLLPFSPTGAQRRAVSECINDMTNGNAPMNRLLQGDVGSGKTAVAAAVCYTVVKNKYQCAIMAPTEILAAQHYDSLSGIFRNTGIRIELLTGSMRASQKNHIYKRLADGDIDIMIGTHALISDKVEFSSLALVITDEQHRFGVAQRAALVSKGDSPHILVMSATPIPRTLALMIYGDLDLSVLDEMPPGRQKTETLLIDSPKRTRALGFLRKNIREGHQCYIVCPLVEDSDTIDLQSAESYIESLKHTPLSDCRIGLLHGRMKSAEKDSVMDDFSHGRLDILVSTTVIEVGVNVPNATIMLIENAERFGLSQLHQLRGRVGRGSAQSYCILVSDSKSESTIQRLKVMCETNDGFKIADEDLRLRGPGDFFGSRQHGLPELRVANMSDMLSLEQTQRAALRILARDPDLSLPEHRGLYTECLRSQFAHSS